MAEDEQPFAGSLYRVDPDLALTRVLEGTTISNGLGWSPDGRRMYFVDSPTRRVDVFDFEPEAGTVSGRRPLVGTSSFPGIPDGLAVDGEGCLWVAMHDGAAVIRISPEGEYLATVVVPVARPTSCCFAGPELDRLVITSARDAGGLGGDLFVCDAGIAGLPTTAFAG
jgi:sugar lactone lactonase YvrE